MKIEKVPSLICSSCNSYCVIATNKGIECDDCKRVTAKTSDLFKTENNRLGSTLNNCGEDL